MPRIKYRTCLTWILSWGFGVVIHHPFIWAQLKGPSFIPYHAGPGFIGANRVNSMAADALAPGVTRASAVIVLIIWNGRGGGLSLLTVNPNNMVFQCREMMANGNILKCYRLKQLIQLPKLHTAHRAFGCFISYLGSLILAWISLNPNMGINLHTLYSSYWLQCMTARFSVML